MVKEKEEIEDLSKKFLRSNIEKMAGMEAREFDISKDILLKLADYLAQIQWFTWRRKDSNQIKKELIHVIDREMTQKEIDALASVCMDVGLAEAAFFLAEYASRSILENMYETFGGNGDIANASIIKSILKQRFDNSS